MAYAGENKPMGTPVPREIEQTNERSQELRSLVEALIEENLFLKSRLSSQEQDRDVIHSNNISQVDQLIGRIRDYQDSQREGPRTATDIAPPRRF